MSMSCRRTWLIACGAVTVIANALFDDLTNAVTSGATLENSDDIFNQEYWESHLAVNVPSLKMLKRQLRNFRSGHAASVTLVFQATQRVNVRWFRLDTPRLANSEVPNMIPVEGDADYELSSMTSGQVTATTLTVRRFHEDFPQDFETILTTVDGSKQYQLRTVVRQRKDLQLENINSPEWLLMPPAQHSFDDAKSNVQGAGFLDVQCAVFIPKDNSGFTNELIMYRATPSPDNPLKMDFVNIVSIHKDTQNIAERQQDAILIGRRYITSAGHTIYRVGFSTRNATSAYEGIYQCSVERQNDRLYAISTVTASSFTTPHVPSTQTSQHGRRPPLPLLSREPHVELISCERDNYDRAKATLTLTEGVATCFRCRAVGLPRPTVSVLRVGDSEAHVIVGNNSGTGGGGKRNGSGDKIGGTTSKGLMALGEGKSEEDETFVSKYVNVADGGVVEATYALQNPRLSLHGGRFSCQAVANVTSTTASGNSSKAGTGILAEDKQQRIARVLFNIVFKSSKS